MKRYLISFSCLILMSLLVGCAGDSGDSVSVTSGNQIDISKYSPSCFSPYPGNPVLTAGDEFSGSTWNDPSVLKVDGQYVMYASSDVSFNHDIKIYRLISNDGINWSLSPSSAVLTKGNAGSWDQQSVETPSVVYYGNQYHMFYTGYDVTNDVTAYRIGHATSSDGISWTKDAANPIVSPSGVNLSFDQTVVVEPGAVVFGDKIYLYFAGIGANLSVGTVLEVIGLKTFDGTSWSTQESVLEPDQSLYPRGTANDGWYGYSTPSAIVLNNQMHLFFDVAYIEAGNWSQRKLHHAVSSDGRTGWTQDSTAIHSREDFSWTAAEIRAINPFLDNTDLKIFYAGHTGLTLSIGFSSCDLSVN